MTALIIIGAILLVLFGIAMLRATVKIEYRDEVKLSVRVLFIKIGILPKKKKKIKYKHFSAKKLRKLLEKDKKAAEKKAVKAAAKKAAKDAKKAEKKAEKEKLRESGVKPKKKRSFTENIELVCNLAGVFFRKFAKHFRIKVARIKITAAGQDAAAAAIMYGYISQCVAYLLEILDRVTNIRYKRNAEVDVSVDYLAEKPSADINIEFSLRVWHLFDILNHIAVKYFSTTMKSKNKI